MTGLIEPQTGLTQFTRVRDDWGNWFGTKNSQPLLHYVLADEYLRATSTYRQSEAWTEVPSVPGRGDDLSARSTTVARFNDLNRANRYQIGVRCGVLSRRAVRSGVRRQLVRL